MKAGVGWAGALVLTAALGGCAAMTEGATATAPQPAKPIDVARFYTGRWYEIARTPMSITKDCVAGTTDYTRKPDGAIDDKDSCRMGTPDGKEKSFSGPVTILNPGDNTKMRINYLVFGIFRAPRTYWVLDHADDYTWFIVSDPGFKNVSLFSRSPRPAQATVTALTARAKSLGYDISKLEYPAQLPQLGK